MKKRPHTIGVLALQGGFQLHKLHIEALDCIYQEVINASDLSFCDALIMPGGESTTLLKLMEQQKLRPSLLEFVSEKPVWGICAGSILLSKTNNSDPYLGVMDIDIERNGYGRQLQSTHAMIDDYQVSYIRAPIIKNVAAGVAIHSDRDGSPVWVEQRNMMATTFHPELNLVAPTPWHRRLLGKINSEVVSFSREMLT